MLRATLHCKRTAILPVIGSLAVCRLLAHAEGQALACTEDAGRGARHGDDVLRGHFIADGVAGWDWGAARRPCWGEGAVGSSKHAVFCLPAMRSGQVLIRTEAAGRITRSLPRGRHSGAVLCCSSHFILPAARLIAPSSTESSPHKRHGERAQLHVPVRRLPVGKWSADAAAFFAGEAWDFEFHTRRDDVLV